MNRQITLALIVPLLLTLSGCSGPTIDVQFEGNINSSNETFAMQGHITERSQAAPERLENVTVYLYADNGTILNSTTFESIEGGKSREFTLTASEHPKYIIINSPQFWEFNDPDIEYHVRQNGGYPSRAIVSRGELPVTPGTG